MFPGATADRSEAAYVIVGAPLDVSTTFEPGTRFGPDRIRQYAHALEGYDARTDQHFGDLAVHDAGDLHAWDDASEYIAFLTGELSDIVADAAMPVLLGGEHTVTLAGVRAVEPDVLVVCDAHLDLPDRYDDNPLSHACVTRRCLETVDEVIILGARSGAEEEWERADQSDVTVVAPEDLPSWQPPAALADQSVYLSIDIDVVDPGFAPGTGTMAPFGPTPSTVRDAVRPLAGQVVGFDVVEVNDRDGGQAATLAAGLLRHVVCAAAGQ